MTREISARAEVCLPAEPLDETLAFFTEQLGFGVERIFPADAPRVVVLTGHGLRLRLEGSHRGGDTRLRLECDELPEGLEAGFHRAPNGTRIELGTREPRRLGPDLSADDELEFTHLPGAGEAEGRWVEGRADMRYRDLIPGRQGGRVIASQIQIPRAGAVPDYVHHHAVAAQLIYCRRGWVRVVYEGQGAAFELRPGDCVLQPPGIRHRVLEASEGLEVLEMSAPALHETFADPSTELPSPAAAEGQRWGGQGFLRHVASEAVWRPADSPSLWERRLELAAASDQRVAGRVLRAAPPEGAARGERSSGPDAGLGLRFWFVQAGGARLKLEGESPVELATEDALSFASTLEWTLHEPSEDFELVEFQLRPWAEDQAVAALQPT